MGAESMHNCNHGRMHVPYSDAYSDAYVASTARAFDVLAHDPYTPKDDHSAPCKLVM